MTCPVHHWPLKDKNGCWQCYEERRVAGKPQKVNTPKRIPPMSDKKKARERALSKVRQKRKQEVTQCETCGQTTGLTYSHILPVKHYSEFESHPDNALLECMPCHHQWEHSGLEGKMKQASWNRKLQVILTLAPAYFNKLQLKAP